MVENIKREGGNKSLISIIVPVYNVEVYLEKCVESILSQSYKNLEIILVDDGSTDKSGEMCDEYAERDERIIVIHKENGGLSDARNAGMQVAKGEYIGFVDSDDWIESDMYEQLYLLAEENSLDVVAARFTEVHGGVDKDNEFTGDFRVMTGVEMLDINIVGHPQYVVSNSVWDRLYRRDMIADMHFPVGRKYEDTCFSTEVFLRASRCGYLDKKVYHYTIREDSIMGQGLKSAYTFNEDILKDLLPQMKDKAQMLYEAGYQDLGDGCTYGYLRTCLELIGTFSDVEACRDKVRQLILEYKKNRKWIRKYVCQKKETKKDRSVALANFSFFLYVFCKKIKKRCIKS